MAFPTGGEIVTMLPGNTAVTTAEAQRYVDGAVAKLATNHAPNALPDNATTADLVGQMAYARALKLHFLKGEGAIEVPAAESEIKRADEAFAAYDAEHSTPAESASEAPVAYISVRPW